MGNVAFIGSSKREFDVWIRKGGVFEGRELLRDEGVEDGRG